MTKTKKPGTAKAWETGELGEDAESARAAPAERTQAINDALGLCAFWQRNALAHRALAVTSKTETPPPN